MEAHAAPVAPAPATGPAVGPRLVPAASQVEVHHSIHAIDPAVWDALVPPDELQSTHAFIRACEDARVEDARYWHLLIRHRGELIAVASLSVMPVRLDLLSTGLVRRAMQGARRISPGFLQPRVLFCGLPVSAGRPCLAMRSPADAPRVVAAISDAMIEAGREADAQLHCVKEFTPAEGEAMDGLLGDGFFRAWSLPSFRMAVPWRSFDAYIAGMRSGYRRQVRASREVAARAGVRVRRVADWGRESGAIHALYDQVLDRADFQLERLNGPFFRNLNAYLGDRAPAILVERGDRLIAAAILLRSPGLLTFFMAGVDYAHNRRCAAYLDLTTEVVAEAIRSGAPALELGQTSGALKTRLGATAEGRHIYFRCRSPLAHAAFRTTAPALFPATRTPSRRVFRTAGSGVACTR